VIVETGCSGVRIELPNTYVYLSVPLNLSLAVQSAFFNVRLSNDFFVALTQYGDILYDSGEMYEINVGGYQNTRCEIR